MNCKLVAFTGALMLSVDTYQYKVQFRPEELLADVDVQVSGGNN